jgi:hypothetical protein
VLLQIEDLYFSKEYQIFKTQLSSKLLTICFFPYSILAAITLTDMVPSQSLTIGHSDKKIHSTNRVVMFVLRVINHISKDQARTTTLNVLLTQ